MDPDTLLARAQALDEAALAHIFDTYYVELYGYVYKRLRDSQATEDLTAEVFHRLLHGLRDGRGPRRSIRAWLYQVARNLIVDEQRREIRQRRHLPEMHATAEALSLDQQVSIRLWAESVDEHLQALPSRQQTVLRLRFFAGLRPAEIADVLHVTTGAVKALQHRALTTLRQRLAHLDQ
ncbi:MAG: sigma-70 family RNA polymerase sigma factor [Chloroflexi bacterium]|nr:sigma-70 family RNA polymerase sigma factor [Chloroflexota bacterium]